MYQDGNVAAVCRDSMDIDMLPPCVAREISRIFGLGHRFGVAHGRSLPSVSYSAVNARASVRLGVRSARIDACVGGVRVASVHAASRLSFTFGLWP